MAFLIVTFLDLPAKTLIFYGSKSGLRSVLL